MGIIEAIFVAWSFKASETLLGIETDEEREVTYVPLAELQSLWNPFRDWNIATKNAAVVTQELQSLWNPFRDWNRYISADTAIEASFKASETLLGIETSNPSDRYFALVKLQSLWNPFRDWNGVLFYRFPSLHCFKASETLLGIETKSNGLRTIRLCAASKPLKPF